jgi:hypothetical protein
VSNVIDFPEKKFMNLAEAAEYLGLKARGKAWSPQTLRNRISEGRGPRHQKRFGRLVFDRADLDAFVKAETQTVGAYR